MGFKRGLAAVLAAATFLHPIAAVAEVKMIYLTRHAEKAATGSDPALSPEGVVRAQQLATMLKKANIAHIFSTAYTRTRQTAQPLGTALALTVQSYDPSKQAELAKTLLTLAGNALVVGHSNTIPELVRHLGGDPGGDMAETEFTRLYQVSIEKDGSVTTTLFTSLP